MAISLQQVKFAYSKDKSKHRVKEFDLICDSLDINKPEFICISGHTGSGKSTLVQILNCLYTPTKGTITIDEKIVTKRTKLNPIRKKIGLVFQFPEYQLFEDTVLKDVSFGPKNFKLSDPQKRAEDALKLMHIEHLKDESPFSLSGGQMRKVTIAGIIASDPDVLILDEPTAGLDTTSKDELLNILKALVKNGKTVIVITHDMDIVSKYASRLLVMQKGSLVYDGEPDALFNDEERLINFDLGLPSLYKLMKDLNKKLGTNYKTNIKSSDEFISILGGKNE